MSEFDDNWDSEDLSVAELSQSQQSNHSMYVPSGGSQSTEDSQQVFYKY